MAALNLFDQNFYEDGVDRDMYLKAGSPSLPSRGHRLRGVRQGGHPDLSPPGKKQQAGLCPRSIERNRCRKHRAFLRRRQKPADRYYQGE